MWEVPLEVGPEAGSGYNYMAPGGKAIEAPTEDSYSAMPLHGSKYHCDWLLVKRFFLGLLCTY